MDEDLLITLKESRVASVQYLNLAEGFVVC